MHTVSSRRWLILPIETVARELYGKVLLACFAAEQGWGVILGGKPTTRGMQEHLPRGIVMEKSISPGRLRDIATAKAVGNRVSALCEEGLLYLSAEEYRQRRIEPKSFDELDYFFMWGEKQRDDTLRVLGHGEEKMVLSGNPRFDLLRPEFRDAFQVQADAIRKRFGRIILINGNFLFVNNGNPAARDYISYLKSIGKILDEERERLWRKEIRLQKENLRHFLKILPALSKEFPDHSIIIRPHPSESEVPWREATSDLSNVHVLFEGSANEWILASEVTIQNNCTTGIEAFLLGRTSISYRPYKEEEVEYPLTLGVGYQVDTEDSLINLIHEVLTSRLNQDGIRAQQMDLAAKYLANIRGPFACEHILSALEQLEVPSSETQFPIPGALVRGYVAKIKSLINFLRPVEVYGKRKFPGLKEKDVRDAMGRIHRASGKFGSLDVVTVSADAFCIYKP